MKSEVSGSERGRLKWIRVVFHVFDWITCQGTGGVNEMN